MESTLNRSTIINDHYEVIDTRHGLMLVNRHELAITPTLKKFGMWAEKEIELTQEYARGLVLDIGANIGTHTLSYAQTASKVFAFEPHPFSYNQLCANLLLNQVSNVETVKCALGSFNGETTMQVSNPAFEHLDAGCRVETGGFYVPIRTLDSFGLGPVSFIKIDVEGHEFQVLLGAFETMKRDMPVIYVEIHSEETLFPLERWMTNRGYYVALKIISEITIPDDPRWSASDMQQVWGYLFREAKYA